VTLPEGVDPQINERLEAATFEELVLLKLISLKMVPPGSH